MNAKTKLLLAFALAALAVLMIASLGIGRFAVDFSSLASALFTGGADSTESMVIGSVRLPRILLAVIAGAGLSVAGAAFQAIFNNPLATPDTLGVTFGAVLAILFGFEGPLLQIVSFFFGLISVFLAYSVSSVRGQRTLLMLILSGLVIGALFTALINLVKFVADPQDVLPSITYWMLGSLSGAKMDNLYSAAPVIGFSSLILYILRWKMNALCMPEDEARSLGIPVARLRAVCILCATLISACVVSLFGIISWVGLLIPHFCRLLVGSNNNAVVPASLVFGGLFLLAADTVARSATEVEIPVSVLTAVIGAPVFLIILRHGRARL
ncbi:iron ABC transporter permease [uncultured Parasutterella sp.]|uniref:FecCD family ABC transporter permease n=1 Tax=uncultured Parasutterella sp. TaxID=1263098 RepID=UPI0025B3736D|nr:iron ABC transporter permease [uncultured Parasutterella sp.]